MGEKKKMASGSLIAEGSAGYGGDEEISLSKRELNTRFSVEKSLSSTTTTTKIGCIFKGSTLNVILAKVRRTAPDLSVGRAR